MIKIDYSKQNEKRVTITGKTEIFRTNVKDITHITCEESVSTVHLANGSEYSITHLLKYFEPIFSDDNFFKVSRNTLINIEHVLSGKTTHKERTVNVNGIDIKVSRRKFIQLKQMLYG